MKIGDQVGGFRVAADCPHCTNGNVFMAVCIDDPDQVVAIKECNDLSEKGKAAFLHEIEMMRLQLLPGRMPEFHGSGEFEHVPYYAMSWSEDIDLGHKSTRVAVEVTLFLIGCAIDLRERKPSYLYGDFKPENVGIENGHYVLRDWATCRKMIDVNFQTAIVGTPYYRSQTVDYTGICNEHTEIHALGMSFLAMLPLVRRIVYGPAILLAVSPGIGPFKGVSKLEKFRGRIVGAERSFFGLVWRIAGVWKTAIACKWEAIALTAVGIVLGAIVSARTWQRRKDLKAKYAAMIAARAEALAGELPRAAELGGVRTRGNAGKLRGEQQGLAPLPQNSRERGF